MLTIQMDMLQTAALAMLLFLLGRFIVNHVDFLNRCCIPAPVVGGLIFAILHLVTYQTGILTLEFNETLKDAFMDFFFTSVGFGASIKLLKKGALPVLIFLLLATIMVTIQDLVYGRHLRSGRPHGPVHGLRAPGGRPWHLRLLRQTL